MLKKTIEIPSIDINYKPYVPTPPQRDAMEVIEEKSRFKPGTYERPTTTE